jgi:hypothetical protein
MVVVNHRKMTLARAAQVLLHGDEDDEDRRREQPRKIITLPTVRWLGVRIPFWDDAVEFADACKRAATRSRP